MPLLFSARVRGLEAAPAALRFSTLPGPAPARGSRLVCSLGDLASPASRVFQRPSKPSAALPTTGSLASPELFCQGRVRPSRTWVWGPQVLVRRTTSAPGQRRPRALGSGSLGVVTVGMPDSYLRGQCVVCAVWEGRWRRLDTCAPGEMFSPAQRLEPGGGGGCGVGVRIFTYSGLALIRLRSPGVTH